MHRAVEVAALKHVGGRVDGLLGDQHGAEDTLLGVDVLRRTRAPDPSSLASGPAA